jgi:2-polyprenyl-6-methoxyphenol hydroxylase-like FAD-dependent oxidoreductase
MKAQPGDKNTDVLIVGAGPSGLMMACQLALCNIPFRIIDKKDRYTNYSGALIIQPRTIEIFQQMGIARKAIQKGILANEIKLIFNGKRSFILRLKNFGPGLTRFPDLLMLEQSITEQLLTEFIHHYGYFVERQITLEQFSQDASGVTSVVKSATGEIETIRTKYLVGADGAHSAVRKQLQIPFPGKTHPISLFVTDCKAETDFLPDQLCFSFSDAATTGFFPLPGGRWRVDGTISRAQELNSALIFSDIQERFAERTRLKVGLSDPAWFSLFQSNSRCASTFQLNRCFLVGDAAHIHSPVGAQGMNTGMQDSYNLAWKLALVIREKAGTSLLDTYSTERVGVAKKVVHGTDRAFNMVTSRNYLIKIFRVCLLPLILPMILPLLIKQQAIRYFFFRRIAQIGIHYRRSPLSYQASLGKFPSSAPQPGDRLPYIPYTEDGKEANIQDKVKGTDFHLLIFSKQVLPVVILKVAEKYTRLISMESIPYKPGTSVVFERLGIKSCGCYLIRPDMYIAYRSVKPDAAHFESYLEKVTR